MPTKSTSELLSLGSGILDLESFASEMGKIFRSEFSDTSLSGIARSIVSMYKGEEQKDLIDLMIKLRDGNEELYKRLAAAVIAINSDTASLFPGPFLMLRKLLSLPLPLEKERSQNLLFSSNLLRKKRISPL